MVMKSVSWVADEPNLFASQHGDIWYVNGSFHDGDTFSIGSKDSNAALDHRSRLFDLIDNEEEFTLENGKPRGEGKSGTKWTISKAGYPGDPRVPYGQNESAQNWGKPKTTQSGSGPDSRDLAISKAVALKAAAEFAAGRGSAPDVLQVADAFLEWLTADGGPSTSAVADPEGETSGSAPVVVPVGGISGEGASTGAAPYPPGSEEAGFWKALVFACGDSEVKALARINSVIKPPIDGIKDLPFVDAKDLMAALEKVSV